jgi:hypothetical protein
MNRPHEREVDLNGVLPLESIDEKRMEVRGTVYEFKDLITLAGTAAALFGAISFFLAQGDAKFQSIGLALLAGGGLAFWYARRWPDPVLIFVRGSGEVRVRRGRWEGAMALRPNPFTVGTLKVPKSPETKLIRIHGKFRNHSFADIRCKSKELGDLIYVAAYLEAFIRGDEKIDQAALDKIGRPALPTGRDFRVAYMVALAAAAAVCAFCWWLSQR